MKIAWRFSTASSWAWQLSCVQSAQMAMVRACRQWMIPSSVVNVGRSKVGCWKVMVSETTTVCVDCLMTM